MSESRRPRTMSPRRPARWLLLALPLAVVLVMALQGAFLAPGASALSPGAVAITAITPIAPLDSNDPCGTGQKAVPQAMYIQVNVTNTTSGTLTGLTATFNGFNNGTFNLVPGE